MHSSLFSVKWKDVAGAVLSGVILSVLTYLGTLTNIFDASLSSIITVGLGAAVTSLLKAFTTDQQGYLLGGSFKVK